MRKHYSGVLSFPRRDKVKQVAGVQDLVKNLSAAEKQKLAMELIGSLSSNS